MADAADYLLLRPHATPTQQRYIDALQQHGTQGAAAAALGVNKRSIEQSLRALRIACHRRGIIPSMEMAPSTHPVPDHLNLRGMTQHERADGTVISRWRMLREPHGGVDHTAMIEDLLAGVELRAREGAAQPVSSPRYQYDDDVMPVYAIGDAHIGMLAWGPEAGQHHDTRIAVADLTAGLRGLADQSPPTRRALLLNIGDYTHADGLRPQTYEGTPVDVDGRVGKIMEMAGYVLIDVVYYLLTKHEEVYVECIPGNHDRSMHLAIQWAIREHFRAEPRVSVSRNYSPWSCMRWGTTLLGFHHGDFKKYNKLDSEMLARWPEEAGASRHRYWLTGHIHHRQQIELDTCTVITLNTLAPKDAWHSAKGYHGRQQIQALYFHRQYGRIHETSMSIEWVRYLRSRLSPIDTHQPPFPLSPTVR